MRKLLALGCLLCTLLSCEESRFEGFSVLSNGIEYKLHTLGEDVSFQKNEVLIASVLLETLNDSVLLDYQKNGQQQAVIYTENIDQRFLQALETLNISDSATFILPVEILPEDWRISSEKEVKLHVKIQENMHLAQFRWLEKFPGIFVDYEMQEQEQLHAFLAKLEPDSVEAINGIHLIRQRRGMGSYPKKNDQVTVHYEGFLLDGRKFDSTHDRKEPFTYTIGEKDQVLRGFNIGVQQMKENGKALLIIPSQLAFQEGSAYNIVPAHTSVIYEVELLEITRSK